MKFYNLVQIHVPQTSPWSICSSSNCCINLLSLKLNKTYRLKIYCMPIRKLLLGAFLQFFFVFCGSSLPVGAKVRTEDVGQDPEDWVLLLATVSHNVDPGVGLSQGDCGTKLWLEIVTVQCSVILWQFDSVDAWECDCLTVRQCESVTIRQCEIVRVCLFDNVTVYQCDTKYLKMPPSKQA